MWGDWRSPRHEDAQQIRRCPGTGKCRSDYRGIGVPIAGLPNGAPDVFSRADPTRKRATPLLRSGWRPDCRFAMRLLPLLHTSLMPSLPSPLIHRTLHERYLTWSDQMMLDVWSKLTLVFGILVDADREPRSRIRIQYSDANTCFRRRTMAGEDKGARSSVRFHGCSWGSLPPLFVCVPILTA